MAPTTPSAANAAFKRLLPATIAATSVVLGLKVVALVAYAPTPGAVWSKTRQAVMTASVIPDAHAAGPDAPAASPPQPAAGNAEPPPAANSANPSSSSPAAMLPAPHDDAPRVDVGRVDAPGIGASRRCAPFDADAAASDITLHRSQIEARERN